MEMINTMQVYEEAVKLGHGQKPPVKIFNVLEENGSLFVYYQGEKREGVRNLARDLEFQFNTSVTLKKVGAKEYGRLGGENIAGELRCCASFAKHCLFSNTHGCGYGLVFEKKKSEIGNALSNPKLQPRKAEEKKKEKRKMIRRVVI